GVCPHRQVPQTEVARAHPDGAGWDGPSFDPAVPAGRGNVCPLVVSAMAKTVISCRAGEMTLMDCDENPGHVVPVYFRFEAAATGATSGLPLAHRARGTPRRSTSTAVPACSTDCRGVARLGTKPWSVTRVSDLRRTG